MKESVVRKQDEIATMGLARPETDKAMIKKELIRRLDHIQRLAKQKNYAEIEKLLQESYV